MKNKYLNKGDKVNVYSIVLSEPVMNVNELLNWARLERGCEQRVQHRAAGAGAVCAWCVAGRRAGRSKCIQLWDLGCDEQGNLTARGKASI